ncbi:MAG: hypothetical protein GY697_03535 [Desulfobacterales bacterium]|nr:hypothetical protein [Desulfobacterales bacterium]
MNWKTKLFILLLGTIPAFTGYPVSRFDMVVVAGITRAWAVYFLVANSLVLGLCGRRRYARILTAAVLVTLPVVASGGCLSFVISLFEADAWSAQVKYSAHYLGLCVTMLTVVPLALGLVTTIPLQAFEQKLLQNRHGVPMTHKRLLMALRVFNHIVYYVIPNILEVIREERQFLALNDSTDRKKRPIDMFKRATLIVRRMTHVAGEGICAAVQYIPLWAAEIASLPAGNEGGVKKQVK